MATRWGSRLGVPKDTVTPLLTLSLLKELACWRVPSIAFVAAGAVTLEVVTARYTIRLPRWRLAP